MYSKGFHLRSLQLKRSDISLAHEQGEQMHQMRELLPHSLLESKRKSMQKMHEITTKKGKCRYERNYIKKLKTINIDHKRFYKLFCYLFKF